MATRTRARRLPARLPRHLRDARDRRGRAGGQGRRRSGPPDHGWLPLRQGLQLPRPRLLGRAHPAPAGARRRLVPPGVVGRGARPGRGGSLARAGRVRRRVDPALLVHGHPGADPGRRDERPGDEHARGERPRTHDLRHRGLHRDADDPRRVARGRPGGMAERPLRDRLGLEPAVDRAAPLAQAARRAGQRRAAGRGGPVPQPHRPGGRRAPAPAAGHRRRAGHRDDAGDRRCRAPGRGVVPRSRGRL